MSYTVRKSSMKIQTSSGEKNHSRDTNREQRGFPYSNNKCTDERRFSHRNSEDGSDGRYSGVMRHKGKA